GVAERDTVADRQRDRALDQLIVDERAVARAGVTQHGTVGTQVDADVISRHTGTDLPLKDKFAFGVTADPHGWPRVLERGTVLTRDDLQKNLHHDTRKRNRCSPSRNWQVAVSVIGSLMRNQSPLSDLLLLTCQRPLASRCTRAWRGLTSVSSRRTIPQAGSRP